MASIEILYRLLTEGHLSNTSHTSYNLGQLPKLEEIYVCPADLFIYG
jgi:hypothetical protein